MNKKFIFTNNKSKNNIKNMKNYLNHNKMDKK